MTEAKGIRLRGERAISRQTIAQGRPDALRWTCMLVCALLCAIAHETAGAARTRSSCALLRARASVKPRAHRAARSRTHIQLSSPGSTGRPSIPETAVIESIGRGVLDAPLSRSMTVLCRDNPASGSEAQMIEPKCSGRSRLPHLRPECPPTQVWHLPSGSRRMVALSFIQPVNKPAFSGRTT